MTGLPPKNCSPPNGLMNEIEGGDVLPLRTGLARPGPPAHNLLSLQIHCPSKLGPAAGERTRLVRLEVAEASLATG